MTTKETKAGERTVKAWALVGTDGELKYVYLGERDAALNGVSLPCTVTYSLT